MASRRASIIIVGVTLVVSLGLACVAYAYDETTATMTTFPIDRATCSCHYANASTFVIYSGPHGGYTTTTAKCAVCHTVHDAPAEGVLLLPGPTITATCMTCHDGTQGRGVYGAIAARLGPGAVQSRHSVDTTSVVPGGDPVSGGSITMTFKGPGGTLTCTDCHSPHGSEVVTAYAGDRRRVASGFGVLPSTKLLRRRPGDATVTVTRYGSDWCLACHKGRASGLGTTHNHPAESLATTTNPYTYDRIAVLASDEPTSVTVVSQTNLSAGSAPWGGLGGWNRGYLWPYPRTPEQAGHYPICMQCHEDARNVGSLSVDGSVGDAATYTASLDGTPTSGNPAFQNFPHESTNPRLLIETYDDLCLNCHTGAQLP